MHVTDKQINQSFNALHSYSIDINHKGGRFITLTDFVVFQDYIK